MKAFSTTALLLALCACLAFGQGATTTMNGTVTDPTGAAVPGAEVTATQTDTHLVIKAPTNDLGEFAFPSVPAGPYVLTVTKSGFKTATVSNIQVLSGTPATVPVKLEVGQTSESVTVTAGAEVVQTQSAEVSSTLSGRQVTDLPFATRNAVELMVTQAGTSTPTNPRSSTINGLPKGSINITIDGMNSQDNMLKSSDGFFSYIMPSVDSLEEATLQTSAAGVDSTSQGGAQIKFVTRSGTNQIHGGAFYQVRNTALDANYYFNNETYNAKTGTGVPRDIIHLNQYGGHIGGPILKNKLFFFGDVELYHLPGTKAYTRTILTSSAASGIYTYKDSTGAMHNVNLYSLAAGATAPAGARPYASTPDPTLQATFSQILALSGNGAVTSNVPTNNDYNTNTLTYSPTGLDKRNFYTGRIDYNLNEKNRFSLVYDYNFYGGFSDFLNNVVPVFPGTGAALGNDSPVGQSSNRFAGTVSWRTTINANMTNELRGGLNGGTVLFFGQVTPQMLEPWKGYNPSFGNVGTATLSGVIATTSPQRRNAPVKDFSDTFSWLKGRHQLSFGGNFDNVGVFQEIANSGQFPGVTFGIATNDPVGSGATNLFTNTNFPGATSTQLTNAAQLYATLTGRVSSITRNLVLSEATHQYQQGIAPIDRDHLREMGVFAQDTWRVNANLTVTLGLRYEKQFAFQNVDNTYTAVSYQSIWGVSGVGNLYKPGTLTGVAPTYVPVSQVGAYSIPGIPAPSIGAAYQLPGHDGFLGSIFGHQAGSTVLRAGYAISSVREGMNVYTGTYGSNQGLNFSASVDPSNFPSDFGAPGSVLFRDPSLPVRSGLPTSPQYPLTPTFTNALYAIDPNLKMGYVQSWNVSLQRALTRDTVLDLFYQGNHEVRGWRVYSLNETNIVENGFFNEFQIAENNLTIARGVNPSSTNFGNQGLPGQKPIPIIQTALGAGTCGSVGCSDVTTASNISLGQAGTLAQNIATNATRMTNLTNAGYPINFFKVNPTVGGGSANLLNNNGSSFYDAFTAQVNRRLSKGFLVQGSYTFAKALANGATASGTDSSTPFTLRNLNLSKAVESFDIRNAIKINSIYELPFGPGRSMLSNLHNPLVKKAVEGWELSGVMRFQSGTPMFLSGFNQFNQNASGVVLHNITLSQLQSMMGVYKTSGFNAQGQPQGIVYYLPPPPAGNKFSASSLIDNTMAAFNAGGFSPAQVDPSQPYIGPAAAGQIGGNDALYLPWQRHFDLALTKKTRIGEHANIEFRAQALNVFNITNFLPGGNTVSTNGTGNAGFGQITTAYQDLSGTVDEGGRILEFIIRVNF